jgi:hypothetical protein
MKRLLLVGVVALVSAAVALSSLRTVAAGDTQVTAAAAGVLPDGASLGGVPLQGSTFGLGVLIHSDGSAEGDFETVLAGTSLLGAPQYITLEGAVSAGASNVGGSVTFSGTARLDLGDGSVPTSVPFSVTATTSGLQLSIGTSVLPTQTLSAGSIFIQ